MREGDECGLMNGNYQQLETDRVGCFELKLQISKHLIKVFENEKV